VEAVVKVAVEQGVLLEINAQPERLDLADVYARMAGDAGARFVVSTDAHRVAELDWLRYGIDVARRGWLTARDVVNTYPLAELRRILARSGSRKAVRRGASHASV